MSDLHTACDQHRETISASSADRIRQRQQLRTAVLLRLYELAEGRTTRVFLPDLRFGCVARDPTFGWGDVDAAADYFEWLGLVLRVGRLHGQLTHTGISRLEQFVLRSEIKHTSRS